MSRKSVTVLDIRSSEITLLVGERGINHTFVFKASGTEPYSGYRDGKFVDAEGLRERIIRLVNAVEKSTQSKIRELYVGVPGEFTRVRPREQSLSFPKKRKIGERELDVLFREGKSELQGYRFMRATSIIYVTADNRRVVDPVGLVTTSLHGVLSYFYVSEAFARAIESIMDPLKISVRFLPTELAMASYLIPSETRDEYALFLDVGYDSSTALVLLGNGVLVQDTFGGGRGSIASDIMAAFAVPPELAENLIVRANLFAKEPLGSMEYDFMGRTYVVDMDKLVDIVKVGIDEVCRHVAVFLESCSGREIDYKPLYVTGEGFHEIRGAIEQLSKRIERVSELLAPQVPYYNKPTMSSRIALLDMAYADHLKSGFVYRLFNGFGG